MTTEFQVANWRAVEALRAGVPNRDAVQALGSSQPLVETRFREMLTNLSEGFNQQSRTEGMLIAGDFGSGKSHVLEYLQHVALENNYVCSKVVISKETPLYDPVKVYNAAIQSAKVPDRTGSALSAIASKIDFDGPAYEDFYRWVFSPKTELNSRFAASVFVFERGRGDRYPEVSDRILQFWGGARVPETELKGWLRELGEVATYKFDKVSTRELTWQRYHFISRLMVAAGYAGWIVLVDEVELIGRYSLLQRAKSYSEMARLMGLIEDEYVPGLATTLAITAAYQSEVMDEKLDEEKISEKLRSSGKPEDEQLADHAELAMRKIRCIPQERLILADSMDIQDIYDKSRYIYNQAYDWTPRTDYESNNTWRIRQHIKRWINTWDLVRLYPDYSPDMEVSQLKERYSEDLDLEDSEQDSGDEWEN
jgi:hypothetical protein